MIILKSQEKVNYYNSMLEKYKGTDEEYYHYDIATEEDFEELEEFIITLTNEDEIKGEDKIEYLSFILDLLEFPDC